MNPQPCLPGFDTHRLLLRERLTIAEIQTTVARFYHIPIREMTSARRSREVARPRQIAMYLARELTLQSLPAIGRRFGSRDHTTVMYALKQVELRCASSSEIRHDVESLKDQLS